MEGKVRKLQPNHRPKAISKRLTYVSQLPEILSQSPTPTRPIGAKRAIDSAKQVFALHKEA